MHMQILDRDVKLLKKLYSLNEAAYCELDALYEMYGKYFSEDYAYGNKVAEVSAFVKWNTEVNQALANGVLRTAAINIFTSALVNRMNDPSNEIIQIAENRAKCIGASYAGIVNTIRSVNGGPKQKKKTQKQTGVNIPRRDKNALPNMYFGDYGSSC